MFYYYLPYMDDVQDAQVSWEIGISGTCVVNTENRLDAYMDVGGRATQEQLPSDSSALFTVH